MAISKIAKFCCASLVFLLVLCSEESSAMQHYCGKALEQALDNICLRGYKTKIKKSMDFNWDNNENNNNKALANYFDYANYNEIADEPLPYPYAISPFLFKIQGDRDNLLAKTRRRRHGISDECCTKGCTITELVAYCL